MAKTKTKAPKQAKRVAPSSKTKTTRTTTRPTNDPYASLDKRNADGMVQLAEGSPVFVRWSAGVYKLGLLARYTREGKPIVQICAVDPKGKYVPRFGTEERTFEISEVTRVYMETDWMSVGVNPSRPGAIGESSNDCDARIKRGPSHDELQRPKNTPSVWKVIDSDNGADPNVATFGVIDEESARSCAQMMLDGKSISRGTMHDLARWTIHMIEVAERWKEQHDDLEQKHDRNVLATQAKGPPKKNDIIDLWLGRGKTEEAKVTFVDASEVHFVCVDGNAGSRPLSDEGDSWMFNVNIDAKVFDARVANWARMNPSKAIASRVDEILPASEPIKVGAVEVSLKLGDEIEVRVGRHWERVIVDSCNATAIMFHGADGSEGHAPTSKINALWRHIHVETQRPLDDATPVQTEPVKLDAPLGRKKRSDLPKTDDAITVDGKLAYVEVCARGYLAYRIASDGAKGRLRTSDPRWKSVVSGEVHVTEKPTEKPNPLLEEADRQRRALESMPMVGERISLRTGGSWETVTVSASDELARMLAYQTSDGIGGVVYMRDLDRTWRTLSNAERARFDKKPAELAQGAEDERKRIEREGNQAARKAAGVEEPTRRAKTTPIDRAVADAKTPRMTVTSERVGPPIEESFLDDVTPASPRMTLHQRNVAASKRLGLPVDEVMRQRQAGALVPGPEDREAEAEQKRERDRKSAGVDVAGNVQYIATGRSGDFVSLPKVGETVYVMSVSGWFPASVTSILRNGFMVQGGLSLLAADHGKAWISERERNALDVHPDADELSVASERELRDLGKERTADGSIRDIKVAPATYTIPDDEPMPWDD